MNERTPKINPTQMQQLINDWAFYADAKQHEKQVELFAENFENLVIMPDGTRQVLNSKLELLDGIKTALSSFKKTFHFNGQVKFDGTHATSYCVAHHVKPDGSLLVMYIRYEDDFVVEQDNVKFGRRELNIEIIEER